MMRPAREHHRGMGPTRALLAIGWLLAALLFGCMSGPITTAPPQPASWELAVFGERSQWAPAALPASPGPIRHLWEVHDARGLRGYAADMGLRSRSGRFTARLLTDARARVLAVRVVQYPHARGAGVRRTRFARQFEGRGPESLIRLGEDIDGVSGATISCRAVARGVRESLRVLARRADGQGSGQ